MRVGRHVGLCGCCSGSMGMLMERSSCGLLLLLLGGCSCGGALPALVLPTVSPALVADRRACRCAHEEDEATGVEAIKRRRTVQ
jgi:hypothetical protein